MASPQGSRSTVREDIGAGRYPRALYVALVCWLLLAVTLVLSGVGAPTSSDTDRETRDAVDALNQTQVKAPPGQDTWWFPYLWVLGVIVVILAVLLALRHGWTRILLAAIGALTVVALARSEPWFAVAAGVVTVVGSICGLMVGVHRYLQGTAAATPSSRPDRSSSTEASA